ncbi:MAG: protein-export chaperone SecB, partial [Gammaproteobacteria bacterium]
MADIDAEKSFSIKNIYVKDLSFEAPKSPAIFSKDVSWKPKLTINIGWVTNKLSETTFESVLKATVTANLEEKTAYLVELEQAGLFEVKGYSEKEMEP